MDRASRLRMSYTAMLLRSFNKRFEQLDETLASFDAKLRGGRATQEATLLGILKRNAGSAYGRRFGFASIGSYEEYRSAVPAVDHEALRPLLERMVAGEADVLIKGKASYFSTTSGTTAAPKFLPGTQQSIAAGCEAVLARNSYLRRDHPEAFAGQPLFIVGNAAEGTTEDGVGYGAMTGFGYYVGQIGFRGTPFPYGIFTIADYRARYYCILRLALAARDLSLLSVYNPSTLLLLLRSASGWWDTLIEDVRTGGISQGFAVPDAVLEELQPFLAADPGRAEELRTLKGSGPRQWWPKLTVLLCWKGGAVGFYLEDLRSWIGDLPVRDLGIFASEALLTIPVDDTTRGGVLLPESGFFEFVPVDGAEAEVRPSWELEEGKEYRVLVTNHGGLYRYDLSDIVRVEGRHCTMPLLSFLHRAGRIHSFTGEKLTEFQVTEAVRSAAATHRLSLTSFTAVPNFEHPPFYELRIETRLPMSLGLCRQFVRSVDTELKGVNIEYASKRESGRLAPLRLALVESGSFEALRRAQTIHDAQYKEAHLATDPDWAKQMRVITRISAFASPAELPFPAGGPER